MNFQNSFFCDSDMTVPSTNDQGKCRTLLKGFPTEMFMKKKEFLYFFFINGRMFCCNLVHQFFLFGKFDVFGMSL